jgi:hypothetical protein
MEITFKNYIELKQNNLSRANIAEIFNIPDWKLKKLIAQNGWGTKPPVLLNTSAFDEYTEKSCYWAGFLAADGNVDSKGRIRLMLKYDDILHLQKFKEYLQSTHTVSSNTTTYNRCSFEFTNKEMCEVLDLNFNIVPEKSLAMKFPHFIKPDMMPHFLRGYFDGDGSICESYSNKASVTATLYATFCSGSFEFINYIYVFITDRLKTKGHLQDFGTGKKWQIKYNTNDAIKLLNYMYSNCSVALDRKYALYERIVKNNDRMMR